jgi:hypothetical protein
MFETSGRTTIASSGGNSLSVLGKRFDKLSVYSDQDTRARLVSTPPPPRLLLLASYFMVLPYMAIVLNLSSTAQHVFNAV